MQEEVVVVGGGIAGLEACLRLEKMLEAKIKLIEPREAMSFYPSMHKIIEGEEVEKTVIDYEGKFGDRNIEHIQSKMTGLEREHNTLKLENGEVEYDKLVLAFGLETNFFGTNQENSCCLRSIEDVKKIRNDLKSGIEQAVVVGGGATGVEAAASLANTRKKEDFSYEVKIIQGADRLLPRNKEKTSKKVQKELEDKGIEIKTDTRVEEVNEDCVQFSSGVESSCDLTIWAAGIKNKDLLDEIDIPQTKKGIKVDKGMRVEGSDDIYAVGDIAAYEGKVNRAYYALSEAKTAAKNIKADIKGGKRSENSFFWDPQVIYLGGRTSALELSNVTLTGLIPHIIRKYFVDKRYLILRRHIL